MTTGVETEPAAGKPPCSVKGCEREQKTGGLCGMHYVRRWRGAKKWDDPKPQAERTCEIEGCGNKHYVNGLCRMHHARKRREDADWDDPGRRTHDGTSVAVCSIQGCDREHYAKGLCRMHYERKRKGFTNWADPNKWPTRVPGRR